MEAILDAGLAYTSGAQWLADHVLAHRKVIAVSGTHGKTTTTSLLVWLLNQAGLSPGFLIGGVQQNLNSNASLGHGPWFVIEADEYDTAFFDKRPKFMHYRPDHLIINNLEYDHADIYPDLESIQTQFSYLLRTLPSRGQVIYPAQMPTLDAVIETARSKKVAFGTGASALWLEGDRLCFESGEALACSLIGIPCSVALHWLNLKCH